MGADASIYSLIRPVAQQAGPLDQFAQLQSVGSMLDQNKLHALQVSKLQRDMGAEEELRAFLKQNPNATPEQVSAINPAFGLQYGKAKGEALKTSTEVEKNRADVLSKSLTNYRDMLAGVNDPQAAAQWIMAGFNDPVLSPTMQKAGSPQEIISRIPQDQQAFQAWKMAHGLGIQKYMEMTAPKMQMVNTGKQTVPVETNALAPGFSAAPIQMTTTPGQDQSNATTIEQGNLNRGVTLRGQNMTDARAREANANTQGNQAVNTEGKLRDDYNKASQEFVKVRDAHQRVLASAKDPSAAGDLALIFNYMKVLDPGSTVREGEFATAQNSGSIPERIRSQYNKAIAGERLSDSIRNDFVDRSGRLYAAAEDNQKKIETQYSDIATRSRANPQNVVLPQRIEGAPTQSKPTTIKGDDGYNALPKGALYIGPDGVTRRK